MNNVPLENNNLGEGGGGGGNFCGDTVHYDNLGFSPVHVYIKLVFLQMVTQLKELQDSQELVKQLQTQLDQQVHYLAEGVASFPDQPPHSGSGLGIRLLKLYGWKVHAYFLFVYNNTNR